MLVRNLRNLKNLRLRRISFVPTVYLLSQLCLIASLIWAVVLATHTDDNLPEFLRKLRPAGNCLCESSTSFDCRWSENTISNVPESKQTDANEGQWQFEYGRDDLDLRMSENKCNAAFPFLFDEVHRAVSWRAEQGRNISRTDLDEVKIERGRVRVLIVDGKIRVLQASHSYDDHRSRALATLYSIQRAIAVDPTAVPNMEFIISVDDMVDTPTQHVWALTRRPQDQNLWIIPDFGFWSWNIKDVGAIDDIAAQIISEEAAMGLDNKVQKLVWRGTTKMLPKLRRALLDASRGQSWSDVAALTPPPSSNYLSAAEQCKYMFLAHVEGRSYSGSLKYRQLCRSVIIIHKLQWIQHHHYLMVANGTEQNYVEVERDFSDLRENMEYLISHPAEARRIADNNIKTFRERYFTPAATACYWRALIRGWAVSSAEPEVFETTPSGGTRPRGMRFENFVLLNSDAQMEFKWN